METPIKIAASAVVIFHEWKRRSTRKINTAAKTYAIVSPNAWTMYCQRYENVSIRYGSVCLVRNLALLEAVCAPVQPVDALPASGLARHRVHRAQHLQVVRDRRLAQPRSPGQLADGHPLFCPPEHADEAVAAPLPHDPEAVGAQLPLAGDGAGNPRRPRVRAALFSPVFRGRAPFPQLSVTHRRVSILKCVGRYQRNTRLP